MDQVSERDKFWSRSNYGKAHFCMDRERQNCLLQIEGGEQMHCSIDDVKQLLWLIKNLDSWVPVEEEEAK